MKKIANWTIGSFFRTIGRVIAYTLFGLLIGYLLNHLPISKLLPEILGLSVLKADTVSYTNTRMDIYQCEQDCNVHGTNCIMNNCIWDSGNPPQETVQFGSSNGHMKKVQFIARTNSGTWNSGTYHLTMYYYTTPFSMSTYTDKYNLRFYVSPNYNLSSYSEGISNYISFYNCSITQRGGSGNGFDLTCDFGVTQPIKNVMVEFDYKEADPNVSGLPNSESAWYGGISQFTTSTDSTGAINAQTTVIQNNFNETNQNITDIKDSITDESAPDITGLDNGSIAGWLPPGPVDSILNLPLTLLNALNRSLSGVCAPITIPLPYVDDELPIPCLSSLYTNMGVSSFFSWVGNIAAAFILFKYLISLYKYVDDTLTFRENHYIDNWGGVD